MSEYLPVPNYTIPEGSRSPLPPSPAGLNSAYQNTLLQSQYQSQNPTSGTPGYIDPVHALYQFIMQALQKQTNKPISTSKGSANNNDYLKYILNMIYGNLHSG